MLLAVDIGNTNIALGVFDGEKLVFEARLATDSGRTADQYAAELSIIFCLKNLDKADITGAIISSVVPEVTYILKDAVFYLTGIASFILGINIKSGLKLIIDNPDQLGADLAAGAVAAIDKYPLPCLVLDLGTATKISVIDKNAVFRGCVIAPGVGLSLAALSDSASLLPSVNLDISECPAFGTDTITCMQAGVLLGTASMLDGLCDRIENELGEDIRSVVATGGHSANIVKYCKRNVATEPGLILHGLKVIYDNHIV